jgi:hypothetical protein
MLNLKDYLQPSLLSAALQRDIMVSQQSTVDQLVVALFLTVTDRDVFGNEDGADIKYKTLSWPLVAVLMIAEIVSNGMLSLPAATAVVGIVPGVILIVFLGKRI